MTRLTRGEAIRAKCLDCACGSYTEVRLCPVTGCALYRFRLGREERGTGKDTPETPDAGNTAHTPDFPAENATEEVRRG